MNKLQLFIIAIASMLGLASCGSDPEQMKWECPAYDQTEISVVFNSGFYTEGQIMAKHGYSGEVTLVCVNYSEIYLEDNAGALANMGCTAEKVSANSVKLVFEPMVLPAGATITGNLAIQGKSKNGTTVCNLLIGRQP